MDNLPTRLEHPERVREIISNIEKKANLLPDGASEFQLRNFVVGSEFTDFGRFKQCVVELRSRVNNLEKLYLHRERIRLDIEEIDWIEGKTWVEKRRKNLDLAEKRMELLEVERRVSTIEGEMEILSKILGEFPEDTIHQSEESHFEEELRRKIFLCLATNQALPLNTLEAILNMPEGSEIRVWLEKTLDHQHKAELEQDDGTG